MEWTGRECGDMLLANPAADEPLLIFTADKIYRFNTCISFKTAKYTSLL